MCGVEVGCVDVGLLRWSGWWRYRDVRGVFDAFLHLTVGVCRVSLLSDGDGRFLRCVLLRIVDVYAYCGMVHCSCKTKRLV